MDTLDDEEDEVVAEYPLYAADLGALFNQGDQVRLQLLQYPTRPPWRGYDVASVKHVSYKPAHRMLSMTVAAEPLDPSSSSVHLKGVGKVPEVPLCAMCAVDGAFVLVPIEEVANVVPDLAKFQDAERAKDAAAGAGDEDPDFVAPAATKGKAAAAAKASKMKSISVAVTKQETERQAALRVRTYTYHREQMDADVARTLQCHGVAQGREMLMRACRELMHRCPGDVAMGMSVDSYLRLISPRAAPQVTEAAAAGTGRQGAGPAAQQSKSSTATSVPSATLDSSTLAAVQRALQALFEQQSIVDMDSVRVWLTSYKAAPAAASAGGLPDEQLAQLMLSSKAIRHIRGRFIMAGQDKIRHFVLDILEASPNGVRKSDMMKQAKEAGMDGSEHAYMKVLRDFCAAQGAVWNLKPGTSLY